LDAFGTEPAYNDETYAKSHGLAVNHWGMLGLNTKQFYTLYPHTADNSFLGFVISSSKLSNDTAKENYALIMGKEKKYLQGKLTMLTAIQELIPLKATMPHSASSLLPPGAETLGMLDSQAYKRVASKAKICIGLGDPVESPGVLEMLASGCVFLNPRRKGAHRVFHGKPTGRQILSQVPYLEDFIGPPHTYATDEDNLDQVVSIINTVLSAKQVEPIIAHEFTVGGYLQRLNAFLNYQDLCDTQPKDERGSQPKPRWPPASALQVVTTTGNASCQQACHDQGLICEPDFFPLVNQLSAIQRLGFACKRERMDADLHAPAYIAESRTCVLQQREQLFSCAGGRQDGIGRICPCRDYIHHQLALCQQCLT
jgi:hypothetical protein